MRPCASAGRLGLGVALGLATATKLSGALAEAGLALFALVQQAARSWTDRRLRGRECGLMRRWPRSNLHLVNPVLYPNPVVGALLLFEHRRDETEHKRSRRLAWRGPATSGGARGCWFAGCSVSTARFRRGSGCRSTDR